LSAAIFLGAEQVRVVQGTYLPGAQAFAPGVYIFTNGQVPDWIEPRLVCSWVNGRTAACVRARTFIFIGSKGHISYVPGSSRQKPPYFGLKKLISDKDFWVPKCRFKRRIIPTLAKIFSPCRFKKWPQKAYDRTRFGDFWAYIRTRKLQNFALKKLLESIEQSSISSEHVANARGIFRCLQYLNTILE
jgi:hypothetical protein